MKVYRSRIGWEIWGPVTLLLGYEGYIFIRNSVWLGVLLLIMASIFFILLAINTKYYVADNSLRIKSWFIIDREIDIRTIHRIRNTWNPIASPAASLFGRIEVHYDTGKSIIISPSNKEVFIAGLLSKNKSILTFEAD